MIVDPYMMWPKFPKLASIVPAPSSIEATRVDGYITFSWQFANCDIKQRATINILCMTILIKNMISKI